MRQTPVRASATPPTASSPAFVRGTWRITLVGVVNPQFGWYSDIRGVTRTTTAVTFPSETILLSLRYRMSGPSGTKDGANSAWGACFTSYDWFDSNAGGMPGQRNGIWGAPRNNPNSVLAAPYMNRSNFVFTDSSARSLAPEQTVNMAAPYAGGCIESNFWRMWDATREQ